VKLGQPVPESNLSDELNRGSPVARRREAGAWLSRRCPERRLGGVALGDFVLSYVKG
jgi:hypothetical protein